jgi:hypothetical protein
MLGWGALFQRWRQVVAPVKLLAGLLAALGFLVALLGVSIDYHSYYEVIAYQLGRGADVQEARVVPEFSPLLGHAWLVRASLYDAFLGGKPRSGAAGSVDSPPRPNPFLRDYPWAKAHPELYPAEPERAVGFGFWFATREPRLPFVRFWSAIVACWLACSLVPLSLGLWRLAKAPALPEAVPTTLRSERRNRASKGPERMPSLGTLAYSHSTLGETSPRPSTPLPVGERLYPTGVPDVVPPLPAGEGARR